MPETELRGRNQAGRVIVYPKGVWNKDDVLPLHVCRNSAGDSVTLDLDPGQQVINVPLTTIDKVVAELHLPRVDFIKMDIKGSEKGCRVLPTP